MVGEWLQNAISEAEWTETDYLSPHEYVLIADYPEMTDAIRAYIDLYGYTESFDGQVYKYYDVGPYKYWIYKPILNRARLDIDTSHIE